jgi:YD repeat-containing protein
MKYFPPHPRHLLSLTLIAACAVAAVAGASAQESQSERKNQRASANSPAEIFTSLDARFSVALPRRVSGFSPITFDTPQGRITAGETYTWRLDDAQFEIGYLDLQKQPETAAVARAALRKFADDIVAGMLAQGGKILARTDISLAGHVGHEMRLELPQSYVIGRLYAVGGRIYRLASVSTRKDEPQFQETATRTLDSFKLLSPGEIVAERQRRIATATPRPLPQQEPSARKLKSDAEDEGLTGRVKAIYVERQDLSGTWAVQRRKPSQMVSYNEAGNVMQKADYDYKGNLFQIRAYGYVDGERASHDKTIENEYDPPAMIVASRAAESQNRYELRYSFKYKYKYDEQGRLVETAWYGNSGKLWLRYVYHYKGANERETLVYSEDGSLNQKYLATLDAHGNEIEESSFNTKTGAVDNKYAYAYEFDRHGNWTKQTTSKWGTKDGKAQFLPSSITYRTITYY